METKADVSISLPCSTATARPTCGRRDEQRTSPELVAHECRADGQDHVLRGEECVDDKLGERVSDCKQQKSHRVLSYKWT